MSETKAKVKLRGTLLKSLRLAVQRQEESWDAQRDLELEIGQDLDRFSDAVLELAAVGAEAVDINNVKELLQAHGIECEEIECTASSGYCECPMCWKD